MKKIILPLIILILIIPIASIAHSGRTDASGCHTCRTNCASWGLSTGEYHCHRSNGVAQPLEPVTSKKNENGIGTMVPAPEYKIPVVDVVKTQPVLNPAPAIQKDKIDVVSKDNTVVEEEKKVITPAIASPLISGITFPVSLIEIKRPSLIKRLFYWLF